jgi:sialate O-acetylesterase
MKMTNWKLHLALAAAVLIHSTSFADVELPALISSNMVLQRNSTITLWGWADAEEEISIAASWLDEPINTVADDEGQWRVRARTTNSKEQQTIGITSDASDILLENVLFGEVWLASGQSNMQQSLQGYIGQPTIGSQQAIAHADNDNLRLFTIARAADTTPRDKIGGHTSWQSATPASVKHFSVVAYFYGQQLQEILDVPVGMIHSSWGGSLVEAWMSTESLSPIKEVDLTGLDLERGNRFPTVLFNAMISPLVPYTIKGALWYQGEANASRPEEYVKLFPAMVKDWRARWGIGDFPFYYAQIAPFQYDWGDSDRAEVDHLVARMREAQVQCLELIPNSGMAVLMDIGHETVIHPPRKKEVADRLLYNALNKTYGYTAVDYSGPVYDTMQIADDRIYLTFRHADRGLYSTSDSGNWEIAGADRVFYPAIATNNRQGFYVSSARVKEPVAVRYAWRSWAKGTLFGTNLLPVSSFRTDNWNDATRFEEPGAGDNN